MFGTNIPLQLPSDEIFYQVADKLRNDKDLTLNQNLDNLKTDISFGSFWSLSFNDFPGNATIKMGARESEIQFKI